MKSRVLFKKASLLVAGLLLLFAFLACGGGSAVKSDTSVPAETPLEKKYRKIVFKKFQVDQKLEADYPGVVDECENAAITAIKSKNIFNAVERENELKKYTDTLIVKTRITNIRIVSGSARFWFGAAAGGSDMSLLIELIDAATGNVVREKALSTANNPFAATMTGGGTDRSLASDLGKMTAEYISLIQPQNDKMAGYASQSSQKDKVINKSTSSSKVAKTLVVIQAANLKSEPNNKSKTIIKLKKGTKIEFLGESENWVNIKLSTGVTGWVSNSQVKEQK